MAVPDRFAVRLGITKADQAATNAPTVVAAASAVRALWVWMHVRRDLHFASPRLFVSCEEHKAGPVEVNLSMAALCRVVSNALDRVGIEHPPITGKTFRRGGASALTAAAASTATIAAAMRHRSMSMQNRYSSDLAKAEGLVTASRRMDALPTAAAAAAARR